LLPDLKASEIAEVLAADFSGLDVGAAERVKLHLAKIGENAEVWVASGMQRVIDGSLDRCPFCAQNLGGSEIINHYRAYSVMDTGRLRKRLLKQSKNSPDFMEPRFG